MRCFRLLLMTCITFSGGCAAMIGTAGKDLGDVESKEQMHAILGKPVARGVAEDGPYEEFSTRVVIAEDWSCKGEGYAMLLVMTCGTCELIAVPYQICLLGKRSLLGQTVRVKYDREGAIVGVERDGESVLNLFKSRHHREMQPADSPKPNAPSTSCAPK